LTARTTFSTVPTSKRSRITTPSPLGKCGLNISLIRAPKSIITRNKVSRYLAMCRLKSCSCTTTG
jgi:hypothetical protein